MNSINDEKRILSANPPVMRAGVIIANLSWNTANNAKGMVAAKSGLGAVPTFLNIKNVSGFPTNPPMLSPKARLNPTTIHTTLMIPSVIKL